MKKQKPLPITDLSPTTSNTQLVAKTVKEKIPKKKVKLSPFTDRFIAVFEYAIAAGIFKNERQALTKTKVGPTNAWRLRNGKQIPTIQQAQLLCDLTNTSGDYIMGFTDQMARGSHKAAIDMLHEAYMVVKQELQQ